MASPVRRKDLALKRSASPGELPPADAIRFYVNEAGHLIGVDSEGVERPVAGSGTYSPPIPQSDVADLPADLAGRLTPAAHLSTDHTGIPGVGAASAASDIALEPTVSGASDLQAFAQAVADGTVVSIPLADVLSESADADGNPITNLADPTDDQDAATKKYVDDNAGASTPSLAVVLAEGADADGSAITGLADPTDPQDAATRAYVDSNVGGEAEGPFLDAYSRAVLADNPIAYLPLTDRAGTVARDVTGNGHDGVYAGQMLFADGAVFSGGDHVLAPDAGLPSGIEPYTLEARFQKTINGYGSLLQIGTGAPDQLANLQFGSGDGFAIAWYTDDWSAPGDPVVNDGRDHHVAAVWDGTFRQLYLDGVHIGVDNTPGGTPDLTLSGSITIGGPDYFVGLIRDVAIYAVALTPEQIAAHAAARNLSANTGAGLTNPLTADLQTDGFGIEGSDADGGTGGNLYAYNADSGAAGNVQLSGGLGAAGKSGGGAMLMGGSGDAGAQIAPVIATTGATAFGPGTLAIQTVSDDGLSAENGAPGEVIANRPGTGAHWHPICKTMAGSPAGGLYLGPLVLDTTAVTGGLYIYIGDPTFDYVKVAAAV